LIDRSKKNTKEIPQTEVPIPELTPIDKMKANIEFTNKEDEVPGKNQ